MSFTLRAKRTLVGALAMTMVISLMPAGVASADIEAVCANAPDSGFPDKGDVHGANIDCMFAYDVFEGRADGTFGTTAPIRRDAVATMLVNFAVTATDGGVADLIDETIEVPFDDIDDSVHQDEIGILFRLGLIEGTTATTYSPFENIRRDQFATILYNAHVALGVPFADSYDNPFTDIGDSVHQEAILALTGEGIISGQTDTTFNPSGDIQRGQVATLLAASAGLLDDLGEWAADRLPVPTDPFDPNTTVTTAPELIDVQTIGTDVIRWNFDGSVIGTNLELDDWRLYNTSGEWVTPSSASISGDYVLTRFTPGAINTAARAGVRYDGVQFATGEPNLIGDFPMQPAADPADTINPYSPDLLSVENYQFEAVIVGGQQYVMVDFVFETPSERDVLTANNLASFDQFFLVGDEGELWQGLDVADDDLWDTPQTFIEEAGVTTVRVPFSTNVQEVPEGQLRRGYTFSEVPEADDPLVLSANYELTGGQTVDPDLLTVQREGTTDTFRFQFDEAVSPNFLDQEEFWLFGEDGSAIQAEAVARSAEAADEAAVVRARFAQGDLDLIDDTPVLAAVTDSAVRATDSLDSDNDGFNRAAAVTVTIPPPDGVDAPTPGVTALPDLTGVTKQQDLVTGTWRITFSFNAPVPSPTALDWDLYDASGTQFRLNPGTVNAEVSGNSVTIFASGSNPSNDQIAAAVAAGVQTEDVTTNAAVTPEGSFPIVELDPS